jgi:protein-disulfide isomerase
MQHEVMTSPRQSLKRHGRAFSALTLGGLALAGVLAGCRESSATQQPQAVAIQQGTSRADVPDVLATVGDEKITMASVRERAAKDLDELETQYQVVRSKVIETALDSILTQRVLGAAAKKQGKSVDELIAKEVGSIAAPTDADIDSWYKANQDRAAGRPLDQVRSQIGDFLRQQRKKAALDSLQARLNREANVKMQFQPYRLTFDNTGAPFLGSEKAPVTIVEFSDFQCPFCRGFAPTLKLIEKNYGDKVRLVYRQAPITTIHPFAFKAAEASLCAQEQGKFWEMHDAMFGDQEKLAVADLKTRARALGMDGKKFDSCLDSGRSVERVQTDMAEGARVGVKGTPAAFINGRELKGGAVSYDVVAEAIQKELARGTATP